MNTGLIIGSSISDKTFFYKWCLSPSARWYENGINAMSEITNKVITNKVVTFYSIAFLLSHLFLKILITNMLILKPAIDLCSLSSWFRQCTTLILQNHQAYITALCLPHSNQHRPKICCGIKEYQKIRDDVDTD